MGLSKTEAVLASVGYFVVFGTILGLSGVGGIQVEIPAGVPAEEGSADQSFAGAVVECLFTLFTECSQKTVTKTFSVISNTVTFLASFLSFFFQLLTFQVPGMPGWLNSIVVIPPAVALMYVGVSLFSPRGG